MLSALTLKCFPSDLFLEIWQCTCMECNLLELWLFSWRTKGTCCFPPLSMRWKTIVHLPVRTHPSLHSILWMPSLPMSSPICGELSLYHGPLAHFYDQVTSGAGSMSWLVYRQHLYQVLHTGTGTMSYLEGLCWTSQPHLVGWACVQTLLGWRHLSTLLLLTGFSPTQFLAVSTLFSGPSLLICWLHWTPKFSSMQHPGCCSTRFTVMWVTRFLVRLLAQIGSMTSIFGRSSYFSTPFGLIFANWMSKSQVSDKVFLMLWL